MLYSSINMTLMTKQQLLTLLVRHSDLAAASVADELGGTHAAAGMLVLRLNRQGLIQRTFDPDDGIYFYSLTPKGRARLAYLTQRAPAR